MIIRINDTSSIPIYLQIRNQIVEGISSGQLEPGETLPSVRALAAEIGINSMTVSKTYQMLKTEGYIVTDRRKGARVSNQFHKVEVLSTRNSTELRRIISEVIVSGMSKQQFLDECSSCFDDIYNV